METHCGHVRDVGQSSGDSKYVNPGGHRPPTNHLSKVPACLVSNSRFLSTGSSNLLLVLSLDRLG